MRAAWGQAKGEGQLVGPTIELLRPTHGPFEPATTGGFPERGWFPHLGGGGSGRAGVPSVCWPRADTGGACTQQQLAIRGPVPGLRPDELRFHRLGFPARALMSLGLSAPFFFCFWLGEWQVGSPPAGRALVARIPHAGQRFGCSWASMARLLDCRCLSCFFHPRFGVDLLPCPARRLCAWCRPGGLFPANWCAAHAKQGVGGSVCAGGPPRCPFQAPDPEACHCFIAANRRPG